MLQTEVNCNKLQTDIETNILATYFLFTCEIKQIFSADMQMKFHWELGIQILNI